MAIMASAATALAQRAVERARMEEDIKKMMSMPRMTIGPSVDSVNAALEKRVKELEGYMPVLLDKLEKQDEIIQKLNDRVDGFHRDLGRAML